MNLTNINNETVTPKKALGYLNYILDVLLNNKLHYPFVNINLKNNYLLNVKYNERFKIKELYNFTENYNVTVKQKDYDVQKQFPAIVNFSATKFLILYCISLVLFLYPNNEKKQKYKYGLNIDVKTIFNGIYNGIYQNKIYTYKSKRKNELEKKWDNKYHQQIINTTYFLLYKFINIKEIQPMETVSVPIKLFCFFEESKSTYNMYSLEKNEITLKQYLLQINNEFIDLIVNKAIYHIKTQFTTDILSEIYKKLFLKTYVHNKLTSVCNLVHSTKHVFSNTNEMCKHSINQSGKKITLFEPLISKGVNLEKALTPKGNKSGQTVPYYKLWALNNIYIRKDIEKENAIELIKYLLHSYNPMIKAIYTIIDEINIIRDSENLIHFDVEVKAKNSGIATQYKISGRQNNHLCTLKKGERKKYLSSLGFDGAYDFSSAIFSLTKAFGDDSFDITFDIKQLIQNHGFKDIFGNILQRNKLGGINYRLFFCESVKKSWYQYTIATNPNSKYYDNELPLLDEKTWYELYDFIDVQLGCPANFERAIFYIESYIELYIILNFTKRGILIENVYDCFYFKTSQISLEDFKKDIVNYVNQAIQNIKQFREEFKKQQIELS